MMLFSKNLKKRIEKLGLSDAEAARLCGLAERRFGNYVTGKREPDLQTLVAITKSLGTTPDELLGVKAPQAAKPAREKLDTIASTMKDGDLDLLVRLARTVRGWKSKGK